VGEVHAQGFIHRDVCPRNFIVENDASALKLIDFGLTLPATPEFMQPGNRTGTPQYMAPEIARRRATDLRVDIFSLGVSFYQLIAFELPWPSSDMTGKVAMLHDTKKPIDLLSVKPDVHPALAKTIHQCMAARPEQRPDDIPALIRQLHQIKTDI
jgi:serine/threonine-protein kinase